MMISRAIFVSAILMATMSTPAFANKLEANIMEALNNDINDIDFDFAQIDSDSAAPGGGQGAPARKPAGGQQQQQQGQGGGGKKAPGSLKKKAPGQS